MRILGSRLTYANVMATLAVFIALGSAAYAADTVGSADVIDDSLQSVDVRTTDPRRRKEGVAGWGRHRGRVDRRRRNRR